MHKAFESTRAEAIDHQNPPKPLPVKPGSATKPAPHPAFKGDAAEPVPAKPVKQITTVVPKIVAAILLLLCLGLRPAVASTLITNDMGGPIGVSLYTNAPALTIAGLTVLGTNANTTLTNAGAWSGVLLVNTQNNFAVATTFTAWTATNNHNASYLLGLGHLVYYNPNTVSVGTITNGNGGGGGGGAPQAIPAPVSVWGGTNNPNGLITSGYGSIYNQFDAATGTNLVQQWVKQNPAGNTNWMAVGSTNFAGLKVTNSITTGGNMQVAGNAVVIGSFTSDGSVLHSDGAGNLTGLSFTGSGAGLTSIPLANVVGAASGATVSTNTILAMAAAQTTAQVSTSAIPAVNIAGTVTNVSLYPEVDAFMASNSIGSVFGKQRLQGFEQELKSFGCWTNLVDAVIEKPNLLGSLCSNSFLGRPLVLSNVVYDAWGARFNGSNSAIKLFGLGGYGLRTNTLVLVMRQNQTNTLSLYNMAAACLLNTNTFSACLFDAQWGVSLSAQQAIAQRNGTNQVAVGNNNCICPLGAGSYSYTVPNQDDGRTVWVFTSDGNGAVTAWKNGVQCRVGAFASNFVSPLPGTNYDELNSLWLGADIMGGQGGQPVNWGNFCGRIDCAMVFKGVADSNLVRGIHWAARYLEPETDEYYFIADSRASLVNSSQPAYAFSDWPHKFMAGLPSTVATFQDLAQPGTSYTSQWNGSLSGTNYIFPLPLFVKQHVYDGLGINDYGSAGGITGPTYYQYTASFATCFMGMGAEFVPVLVWPMATNCADSNDGWTLGRYTNIIIGSQMVLSNAWQFSAVARTDLLGLDALLAITNGVAPYSLDGLHFSSTNGPSANQLVANEVRNPARPGGVSKVSITYTNYIIYP